MAFIKLIEEEIEKTDKNSFDENPLLENVKSSVSEQIKLQKDKLLKEITGILNTKLLIEYARSLVSNQNAYLNTLILGLLANDALASDIKKSLTKQQTYFKKTITDLKNDDEEEAITLVKKKKKLIILPNREKSIWVGDIHANLNSVIDILNSYELFNPNTQFIFLGDFVDRGTKELETLYLLLTMKIKFPHRVHLLKGNHEFDSRLWESYGFNEALVKKFPKKTKSPYGKKYPISDLCEPFKNLFEKLPILTISRNGTIGIHAFPFLSPKKKDPKSLGELLESVDEFASLWGEPFPTLNHPLLEIQNFIDSVLETLEKKIDIFYTYNDLNDDIQNLPDSIAKKSSIPENDLTSLQGSIDKLRTIIKEWRESFKKEFFSLLEKKSTRFNVQTITEILQTTNKKLRPHLNNLIEKIQKHKIQSQTKIEYWEENKKNIETFSQKDLPTELKIPNFFINRSRTRSDRIYFINPKEIHRKLNLLGYTLLIMGHVHYNSKSKHRRTVTSTSLKGESPQIILETPDGKRRHKKIRRLHSNKKKKSKSAFFGNSEIQELEIPRKSNTDSSKNDPPPKPPTLVSSGYSN